MDNVMIPCRESCARSTTPAIPEVTAPSAATHKLILCSRFLFETVEDRRTRRNLFRIGMLPYLPFIDDTQPGACIHSNRFRASTMRPNFSVWTKNITSVKSSSITINQIEYLMFTIPTVCDRAADAMQRLLHAVSLYIRNYPWTAFVCGFN